MKSQAPKAPAMNLIKDEAVALLLATEFLSEVGIPWEWAESVQGFLDDVEIRGGGLLIKPGALVSNVLHEAGHLALVPGEYRHLASGGLSLALKTMDASTDFSNPDSAAARASIQCSDPEVTAWAYAVGVHLGLDPAIIILDHQYDNEGAFIRLSLGMNAYAGINGLSHAGLCAVKPGAYAEARELPGYPKLKFWVQPSFTSSPSSGEGVPS